MQKIINILKANKLLLFVLALVLVGLLASLLIKPTGFRIAKTDPKLSDVASLTSFINVEFSEPIVRSSVSIPNQANVKRYEISDKAIKIYINNPDVDKRVTITIDKVTSAQTGKQLVNQKLSFKPKKKEWHQIPKEQQESVLAEQDKKSAYMEDPILAHMPYNTPDYKISAVVGDDDKVRLEAKITPSNADTDDNDKLNPVAVQSYKDAVVKYIQSLGFDPVKYDLKFTVINPATGKAE